MSMEAAGLGAIAGLISAAITVAAFLIARSQARAEQALKIQTATSAAENALQTAAEASEDVKRVEQSLQILNASFAMYREAAIEKFVTHAVLTELEKRLVESDAKSEKRTIDAITELTKRVNQAMDRNGGNGTHKRSRS